MLIDVTQTDISGRRSCHYCPIYKAIRRAIGRTHYLRVGTYTVFINSTSYDLPLVAIKFISKWDAYLPVKPISFDLPITRENL